jgi:hypothetical protein
MCSRVDLSLHLSFALSTRDKSKTEKIRQAGPQEPISEGGR